MIQSYELHVNKRLSIQKKLKSLFSPRFRSITKQYFRKADGVVLLYDLSSESSFINIKSWMTSVEVRTESRWTQLNLIQSKAFQGRL